MESPINYIRHKGLEHKVESGQIVLKVCPFCQDEKSHFYIDQKEQGPFFCQKCNEKGNLWTLKKHLGDIDNTIRPAFKKQKFKKPALDQAEKYHQALLKDTDALAYLEGRGINQESIQRFKIGTCQGDGIKWASIPHYQGGNLVNIKFRSMPPAEKTFKRVKDCQSILFNMDVLKSQKEVFITEGEFDAITLNQAGVENVVSGTTGAGSFDPEWFDQLKHIKKIYTVYDSDEQGQQGARSLAKRLGYNRCFNIELPEGQDVNDYFSNGHGIFDFGELVEEAHRFDLPGVISADTAIELLQRQKAQGDDEAGLQTPWENVNRLTKGFKPGDLIILSAPAKVGKTTFSLNISTELSLQGRPVLFYCLEMRPERLVQKVIQAQYRKEYLSSEDLTRAHSDFQGLPLYLGHSFKKEKLEDILSLIREAIKRYDLRLVVFDNIHFLIRSISNVNEELGQCVQGLKLLAEEMEIPILAIAQPRKREAGGRDEIMRADDIKYSNAVHADCDQMIILYRKRIVSRAKEVDSAVFVGKQESLDPVTLVRIEAHRYGAGGETLLYFHGGCSKFDPLEQNVNNDNQGVHHAQA